MGHALVSSIGSVVRGHDDVVVMVVAAVLSGGHVLVEDAPGSGKTTLARALARSLGGRFARIQGTSDLMPADITGSGVWNPDHHAFDVVPGPLFANVVLVDELNRTPPRTQSGFLEAMEESGVTIDGRRYPLPDPFTLIATQNPLEQHGTYPLPEGQLDRFTVSLTLGALSRADERLVVQEQLVRATVGDLVPVVDPTQLIAAREQVRHVHVADDVLDYGLAVVQGTRSDPRVVVGASPRAALSLVRLSQAVAVLHDRDYVLPDDVKMAAVPCLAHRLVLTANASSTAQSVIREVMARVSVPVGR
ncbi:MAG: MoxR-like ATPase [Nocardioidaceae bacterium]|nr:MoxR-like ATPase [Nocardioidaceae bacterium]